MSTQAQKDVAQNRLLIATAVLSFIYYAGAKFQGLTLVGASIVFSNEGAVLEFAWFIWGYYYIRCYQYYKKLGVRNFRESLNESYQASFGHRLVNLKRHEFELLPDDDGFKSSTIRLGWGWLSETERRRRAPMPSTKLASYVKRMRTTRSHFNFVRPWPKLRRLRSRFYRFSRDGLQFKYRLSGFQAVVYPPGDRSMLKGQNRYTVSLPLWMPLLALAVYARTMIARPEFIENQGPLVLGLIPVWYLIFRNWHLISMQLIW